jgi:actin-related protein
MIEEHYQDQEDAHVVIDNGSDTIKAGFGGDTSPKAVFTCRNPKVNQNESWVGEGLLKLEIPTNYPIQRGIVTNWDTMEHVW